MHLKLQLTGLITLLLFSAGVFISISAHAQEMLSPSWNAKKSIVFMAGAGYGISGNPCTTHDKSTVGGATFSFSLGYKISKKFMLEFGPSFWIESKDLINHNVSDAERPNNKRTIVTFTGSVMPFKFPLTFKIGGGAGVLNYTPEKNTVKPETAKFETTEIFKGFSAIAGLAYEFKLSSKIKIYPSWNFWYIHFQKPEVEYNSYVDYTKPSMTADLRLSVKYNF